MSKKIIVFLCILSLLVPFLPHFDFVVLADDMPNVSNDNLEEWQQWLSDHGMKQDPQTGQPVPISNNPLSQAIQEFLFNNGYVVKDDFSIIVDSLQGITGINILEHGGLDSLKDYVEQNNYPSLSTNIVNYSITYAEGNAPYYVYRSMPVSEFFSYFVFNPFIPASDLQSFRNWLVPKVNNNVDQLCGFYCFSFLNDNTNFLVDYSDLLDEYSLALYSGQFYNYPDLPFQSYEHTALNTDQPYPFNNILKFYSNDLGSVYDGNFNYWTPSTTSFVQSGTDSHSCIGFVLNRFYPSNYHNCNGTLYLSPDSVGSISFPVFRSGTDLQLFYKGRSDVYRFDSSIDLGQYGDQIDYSKLYDIVSSSIRGSSGNVIDAINNAVDNYLQEQIDLLHDINNALNDGNGQSWLRRIYGILYYNFPLTLTAFQDLIEAVQNISVSGGVGDFSEATQVLHDIDIKLGILIDKPFTDLTDDDWNSMKSRVQTKFPFCIFSDIVAISVILNRPPQQPDLNFVVPIMGSESENMVHIDLSPYEHARPYVHGILIFVFIIGLLALSVKIFDHLKS